MEMEIIDRFSTRLKIALKISDPKLRHHNLADLCRDINQHQPFFGGGYPVVDIRYNPDYKQAWWGVLNQAFQAKGSAWKEWKSFQTPIQYTIGLIGVNQNILNVENNAGKQPTFWWVRPDHMNRAKDIVKNQKVDDLKDWVRWENNQPDTFDEEPSIFQVRGEELENLLDGRKFFWGMC